jgi:transcriptional regulator with XRE-family HTH domain
MDALIAGYLLEAVQQSGVTYRQIASDTGMSINRIGIILRQESPPATLGEIGLIGSAVGLTASELVERAESVVRRPQDYELVANESIDEFPEGNDADYDNA